MTSPPPPPISAPPSKAQAAQIPLQSFTIPTFPPEAFEADLRDLVLTSDIRLDEYSGLLEAEFEAPDQLPKGIKGLALEGFVFGFPPRFLPTLTSLLPNLTSLTLYSLTLGGPSPRGSQKEDALQLLNTPALRELHVIDVFTGPGFWAAPGLSPPALKVVEFAYKYRGDQQGEFDFIDVDGIVDFVGKLAGVVGLTACLSLDAEEGGGRIDVVRGEQARRFAGAVEKAGKELVVFDGTMFALQLEEVKTLLKAHSGLKVLAVSVSMDAPWENILTGLAQNESDIEDLEVVGVQADGGIGGLKREWMKGFEGKWRDLRSVKISALRRDPEHWVKENETWTKVA